MSRNPKYMTSEDFDAPQLYGDKWGYLNNVFRKCLVQGYNERTDLISYEIVGERDVKFTFETPHHYKKDQVLKISFVDNDTLHFECMVIESAELTVVCRYYTDLLITIGTIVSNLEGKSIVAPLGFREKFKNSDGTKTAYVIDQDKEECFFVVDETTPVAWQNLVTSTVVPALINPNVYMCDSMADIDTENGRLIAPFDPANPTRHKTDWVNTSLSTTAYRRGLMNFLAYTTINTASTNNKVAASTTPATWQIIGNGRFFWFIYYNPQVSLAYQNRHIHGFGKFYSKRNSLNYFLIARPFHSTMSNIYSVNESSYPAKGSTVAINANKSPNSYNTPAHIVLANNKKTDFLYPDIVVGNTFGTSHTSSSSWIVYISGNIKTFYNTNGQVVMTDFNLMEDNTHIGMIPSAKFLFQKTNYIRNIVLNIRTTKNKTKRYVFIEHEGSYSSTTTSIDPHTYAFSLEYEDWKNYD